jgi:hypothetical protein
MFQGPFPASAGITRVEGAGAERSGKLRVSASASATAAEGRGARAIGEIAVQPDLAIDVLIELQ